MHSALSLYSFFVTSFILPVLILLIFVSSRRWIRAEFWTGNPSEQFIPPGRGGSPRGEMESRQEKESENQEEGKEQRERKRQEESRGARRERKEKQENRLCPAEVRDVCVKDREVEMFSIFSKVFWFVFFDCRWLRDSSQRATRHMVNISFCLYYEQHSPTTHFQTLCFWKMTRNVADQLQKWSWPGSTSLHHNIGVPTFKTLNTSTRCFTFFLVNHSL